MDQHSAGRHVMGRIRQTTLGTIREDAANARALPEHHAGIVRRRARVRLGSFLIATSKREAVRGTHLGFRRGQRIYFWCPFHLEKTASCVWYPRNSIGTGKPKFWRGERITNHRTETSHFHCFGCGRDGGEAELVRGLLNPVRPVTDELRDLYRQDPSHWDGECPF